ncbi:MAG: hypothetical protein QOJ79_1546 [Actinomycetota bacterium]|jgi:hypothetical protein|nr:hypothetical protein [Actinomycetota bacterium]
MLIDAAGTCLIGQGTAGGRLAEALSLIKDLPGLLAELEAGRVFVPQAKVLLDETRNLTPELCAKVEARVLGWAREPAPGPLRRKVKAVVLAVDAEEAARRDAARKAERDPGVPADRGRAGTADHQGPGPRAAPARPVAGRASPRPDRRR